MTTFSDVAADFWAGIAMTFGSAAVACVIVGEGCPHPAAQLVIVDCATCGRFSRPACLAHAHIVSAHVAAGGDCTHKPCSYAPAIVDRIVPL